MADLPSLESWLSWVNLARNIGLGAAALAAAIGLIAGVAQNSLQSRISALKEDAFRMYKQDSDARIAEARARGEEARAEAATANRETATLKERAATLENTAAQARLEQERLKEKLAWRTISPDLKKKLTERLSEKPGKINIEYSANDTETQYLAFQFGNIFSDAKWQIAVMQVTYGGMMLFGIHVPSSQYEGTSIVRQILEAENIQFFTTDLPKNAMGYGGKIPDAGTLFVGSKPPS